MLLKNLFVNIFIRVTLIVISSIVLSIVLQHFEQGYYYTLTGMIFLIGLQTIMLLRQVNQTNTDVEKFLSAVQDHDSSIRFPLDPKNKSFRKLYDRMNNINTVIHEIKIENERTSQFLQSVVDHVDIGLLSFDQQGNIEIYNNAVKRYLNTGRLPSLSSLKSRNKEVYGIIDAIKPGQEVLHKMRVDNLMQSVLIKSSELKFENNVIKLVSFQDITSELDKRELDSWQRLIRVLTHEIMNSISPITSLTSVISGYFKKLSDKNSGQIDHIDNQIVSKTLSGLNTIEETGKGLLEFVEKYRSLTLLPIPNLSKFSVGDLLLKCTLLMESNIPENIKISTSVTPENLSLVADYSQVEQILINLVKNAAEAISTEKGGTIILNAFTLADDTIIKVTDNGQGIPSEIIEDIFVPFFTTKTGGSGIGLSLTRQIMQNHNGTISVHSVPAKGSEFTLKFQ